MTKDGGNSGSPAREAPASLKRERSLHFQLRRGMAVSLVFVVPRGSAPFTFEQNRAMKKSLPMRNRSRRRVVRRHSLVVEPSPETPAP